MESGAHSPKPRRVFGDRIHFKSLSCAPVNELGVVYLFGVLHDLFDFSIESIQAGFPDCIARRKVDHNRWEEVRIEFEYDSRSFVAHGHDPDEVDMIVCWDHNWASCPRHIEVIELSGILEELMGIRSGPPKKLTEWQRFCQEQRLKGKTFAEIAKLWREQRRDKERPQEVEAP